jgi:hypothetical protein
MKMEYDIVDTNDIKEFINIISNKDIILLEFEEYAPDMIFYKNIYDIFLIKNANGEVIGVNIKYISQNDKYTLKLYKKQIVYFNTINKPQTAKDPIEKINNSMENASIEDFDIVDT